MSCSVHRKFVRAFAVSFPSARSRCTPSFAVTAIRDSLPHDPPLIIMKPMKKRISPLAVVRNRCARRCLDAVRQVLRVSKPGDYYVISPNFCSLLMPPSYLMHEFASILSSLDSATERTKQFELAVPFLLRCGKHPVPPLEGLSLALFARANELNIEKEMEEQLRELLRQIMEDSDLYELVCDPRLDKLHMKRRLFAAVSNRIAFNPYLDAALKLVLRVNGPNFINVALSYLELVHQMGRSSRNGKNVTAKESDAAKRFVPSSSPISAFSSSPSSLPTTISTKTSDTTQNDGFEPPKIRTVIHDPAECPPTEQEMETTRILLQASFDRFPYL